ncbi:hypothetical protein HYFRA_00011392 [Hymenoscyphus fraxineus]|uniref:Uncharacterized protein n=1 Tax=Hymenoscyphus fraxineus TaxID=746836 RepID=A0A9N9PRY3_9HELO|nr:hypothetical protein HYFRA_00011392 [Hymenoscyphus fraxineus]
MRFSTLTILATLMASTLAYPLLKSDEGFALSKKESDSAITSEVLEVKRSPPKGLQCPGTETLPDGVENDAAVVQPLCAF